MQCALPDPGGPISGNKQAYDAAFERAREGRSRSLLERILSPFEDEYTRQSREKGERDGAAARAQSMASGTEPMTPA